VGGIANEPVNFVLEFNSGNCGPGIDTCDPVTTPKRSTAKIIKKATTPVLKAIFVAFARQPCGSAKIGRECADLLMNKLRRELGQRTSD